MFVMQLAFRVYIRQYRNIDRGIGDFAIIAAPRDHTILYTNACLAHAP